MGIVIQGNNGAPAPAGGHGRLYAWAVFALTFGLMLSDYVSRQVITPIFPFLKQDWSLTDVELGALRAGTGQALASPRAVARLLCGLPSPSLTRARLASHTLCGRCAEVPSEQVMQWAEDRLGAAA